MRKTYINNIFIPVAIAFTVFFGFLAVRNLLQKDENNTDYIVYDGREVSLVVGSRLLKTKNPPIITADEIAIDLDTVRRYIDGTVDWDAQNRKVTVTTRDRLVRMKTDNLTAFVNGDDEITLDLPVFEEDGVVYLPIKFLSEYFEIRVEYNEDNNVVIVDDRREIVQTATVVEKGAVIRLGRDAGEPVIKRFPAPKPAAADGVNSPDADGVNNLGADGVNSPGADGVNSPGADGVNSPGADGGAPLSDMGAGNYDMYVFEDYDGWYKVRSFDGVIGYIEKKYVAVRRYVDRIALSRASNVAWKPEIGKIVMVWEQVNSGRANPETAEIPEMPGLDIVSPTWFSLTGSDGAVESKVSAQYIEWARTRGYQVWALFSNVMNDIEMTSAFLNDSDARENAIRSVLAYSAMFGIDGINLDFENVYLADKNALTQFVRELAPMLREQGMTFSVDVNVPDGSDTWSRCYDTPAIANAADYVNLMAYDQHGARSQEAGSVSQLSWVEANLVKLIERDGVPPEKIILGIPFYTRVWEMGSAGAPRGGKPVNSSAVGMKTAIGNVFDNNASISWDAASGQFFCSYKKNNKPYHVWLEDPHSVNLRSSLAHKYALAGVSAWSRNFVAQEIWNILERNLKQIVTYYQWKSEAYIEEPVLVRAQ